MLILWDVDGTLLKCGAAGSRALQKTFLELYGVEDALAEVKIGSSMDMSIIMEVFAGHSLPADGIEDLKACYIRALEDELRRDSSVTELPGVRELLLTDKLPGSGEELVHMLLTSNLKVGAKTKLDYVGLWSKDDGSLFFDGGIYGDEEGEKWDAALELEELYAPDDVVLIGDSAYDIAAAQWCGFHSISVVTGFTSKEDLLKQEPEYIFDDLADVRLVLKTLEDIAKTRK